MKISDSFSVIALKSSYIIRDDLCSGSAREANQPAGACVSESRKQIASCKRWGTLIRETQVHAVIPWRLFLSRKSTRLKCTSVCPALLKILPLTTGGDRTNVIIFCKKNCHRQLFSPLANDILPYLRTFYWYRVSKFVL